VSSKPQSRDAAIALLLLGLFILIWALINMDDQEEKNKAKGSVQQNPVRAIDLVNQHLREVYDRQEMERQNVENMNALTAPPIHKAPQEIPQYHFDELPLTFDQDSVNELVGKDLRHLASQSVRQRTLSQQIQKEIIDDIQRSAEEEKYKKALAEAIIKKAKAQGYDVQVDDDFKVKSIRKIVKKEAPSVFDSQNLPGR
jgi:hypothetical protein